MEPKNQTTQSATKLRVFKVPLQPLNLQTGQVFHHKTTTEPTEQSDSDNNHDEIDGAEHDDSKEHGKKHEPIGKEIINTNIQPKQ